MKRNFFKNGIYYLKNSGSKSEDIFLDINDYSRFISKIRNYFTESNDVLIQYCLLPNEFHMLVKSYDQQSISKLMQKIQLSHSKYFLFKYKTVGAVFRRRYSCTVIESPLQFKIISRFIHRLPVMFFKSHEALSQYPWSSFNSYGNKRIKYDLIKLYVKNRVYELFASKADYNAFMSADEISIQRWLKSDAVALAKNY